jgi:hypothetical protein
VACWPSAYLLSVRPSQGGTVGELQLTEKIRRFSFSTAIGTPPLPASPGSDE